MTYDIFDKNIGREIDGIEFGDYTDHSVIVYVKSIYNNNPTPIEVKLPKDFMTSNKKYNLAKRIYNAWKQGKKIFETNKLGGAL